MTGVPAAALGVVSDLPWPAALTLAVGAVAFGRAGRWVERRRFAVTMRLHGYAAHGEYVAGREWKGRRRRYLREHTPAGCRVCAREWHPQWPLHHKDYSRAGAGRERDRDLIPVCDRCHSFIHSLDRKRGPLRALGFSLRLTTWAAIGVWFPVRLGRRGWRRAVRWAR